MLLNNEAIQQIRRDNMRELIRSAYQIQKLRIQSGNRMCAKYYRKMGLKPGEKIEDFLKQLKEVQEQESPYADTYGDLLIGVSNIQEVPAAAKAKDLLVRMRKEYKLLSQGILLNHRQIKALSFENTSTISDATDYLLVEVFAALLGHEERQFKQVENLLEDFPIYTEFLKKVRGIGPAFAGILIAEIDIEKARYPSSLHKLSGLDVVITPQPELVATIEQSMKDSESRLYAQFDTLVTGLNPHDADLIDETYHHAMREVYLYKALYQAFANNVGSGAEIMAAAKRLCDFKNEGHPIKPFILNENDSAGHPVVSGTITVADLTAQPALRDDLLHKMQKLGMEPEPYYELLYLAKELMSTNKVEGRGRRSNHLVATTYVDRNGETQTKMGLSFKPILKKTLYLIATSFIKSGSQTYMPVYRNYRARIDQSPKWQNTSKAHRNLAALRYTSKIFINDLYQVWRTLEGLPVKASWEVAKLGFAPHHGVMRPTDWFTKQDVI